MNEERVEKKLHLSLLSINFDCVLCTESCMCFERSIQQRFYHRYTSCIHTCHCCQYKSRDHCRNSMNKWRDAGSTDSKIEGKWRYQRNIDRELDSIDPVHRQVFLDHRDRNGIHSPDNRRPNDRWLCWSLLEIQMQRYDSEVIHQLARMRCFRWSVSWGWGYRTFSFCNEEKWFCFDNDHFYKCIRMHVIFWQVFVSVWNTHR